VGGRLVSIPARQKKRDVILRYLAGYFEEGRMYDEHEVNAVLRPVHEDVASLRRYLVDSGFLQRQVIRSTSMEALKAGTPDMDLRVAYWKPSPRTDAR